MTKKIGPLLLSGLMIGPILGSGIIMLPPLAYSLIGNWSLFAWFVIMFLGALFAMCFTKLSILRPGDGGMTNAVEDGLGLHYKLFTSILMISAIMVGPTAVMLTAADYLVEMSFFSMLPPAIIAIVLVIISQVILLRELKVVSTISFITSTLISVILIIASLMVILNHGIEIAPQSTFKLFDFGKCMLLLFWAIIGWEVIGNYSGQVEKPKRTIPIATIISVGIITITYILIALAINTLESSESLTPIISSLFGGSSKEIVTVLLTLLCLSTYILIVGAIARLLKNLSEENYIPKIFARSNKNNAPYISFMFYGIVHVLVLVLYQLGVIKIEGIIGWANAFFALNAIIGLIAVFKISKEKWLKLSCVVLILGLAMLLRFTSVYLIVIFAILYFVTKRVAYNRTNIIDEEKTA